MRYDAAGKTWPAAVSRRDVSQAFQAVKFLTLCLYLFKQSKLCESNTTFDQKYAGKPISLNIYKECQKLAEKKHEK